MLLDVDQPASKKVLFQLDSSPSELFQVTPETSESPYRVLIDTLKHGTQQQILEEVLNDQQIVEGVTGSIFDQVKSEVKTLCAKTTNSILRHTDTHHLQSFSFDKVVKEWETNAPTFVNFLKASSVNTRSKDRNVSKNEQYLLPAQVTAGAKLISVYNREMSAIKRINDTIFLKGGMKKSAVSRMQSAGDCHSYKYIIDSADQIAKNWDVELTDWQQKNRHDMDLEEQMCEQITYIEDTISLISGSSNADEVQQLLFEKFTLERDLDHHRQTMHPGYYFVGDNVDMVTKVRRITLKSQHKDQHMYQMCAYLNRVSANDKDNSKPLQNAESALFSTLIPGNADNEKLIDNFTYIVAKKWCQYIPCFSPYDAVLPPYIKHEYMTEMKKTTKRVNMGVLKKNEAKNEDMVEICKFLHKYVPRHDTERNEKPMKILSGGDYLTFERHKQAQMSVRDDATPSSRLEGLIPKMEEFHNQAELIRVIWKLLYSTQSSRDIGTMFAARNLINARNVSADPSADYYASATMMDKFTDAYIVAGALNHFSMDDVSAEPQKNAYSGAIGDTDEMKIYLISQAREFVTEHIEATIPVIPRYGLQSNTLKCRYCFKVYKKAKQLRKHEAKEHGHLDPVYNPNTHMVTSNEKRCEEDGILSYSKLALFLGLLRLNHNDAIW